MATHDYVIDNSTGANVRADLNNALQAIVTNNSTGDIANLPATFPFMLVADTTAGTMKIRNAGNNAFIELFQLDGTLTLENGSASTPALAFRTDVDTGIFRSAENKFNVATGGVERMELGTTTIFNEDGADVDFRIEGDSNANLFYVDAGNNRIGIGTAGPQAKFEVDGRIRVLDNNDVAPSAGKGLEISYFNTADHADILSYDRGGSAFKDLHLRGNNLVFKTGTNNAMYINSSGSVGIGTSNPDRNLTVSHGTNPIIAVQNSTQSTEGVFNAPSGGVINLGTTGSYNLTFSTNNLQRMLIDSDGNVQIPNDTGRIQLGASQDLQIYHNGTRSEIQNNTGDLVIQASQDNKLMLRAQTGESHLIGYHNAQVELYYDGSKKAETSSAGFKVTGACFVNDGSATGNRFSVGNGGDLKIFHTNPGSFIQDTSLRLAISSNVVDISDTNGDKMAEFTQDGSAKLYHNGSQKLATSSSGVSVTGTVDESSDIALKSDIQPLTNTLEKLQQITGYKYNLINSISPSMGVIAQDVEKVFPELVHGSEGNKTLQYSGLIGVLVEAVKDLSAKVAALEAA